MPNWINMWVPPPTFISDSCRFKPGDTVRLNDGDGRNHIIERIDWCPTMYGWWGRVTFTDNASVGSIEWLEDTGWYENIIKVKNI